jgi:hypothetical protein
MRDRMTEEETFWQVLARIQETMAKLDEIDSRLGHTTRLTEKCLGLGEHLYGDQVSTLVLSVPEMVRQL